MSGGKHGKSNGVQKMPALSFDDVFRDYAAQLHKQTETELQGALDRQLTHAAEEIASASKTACDALAGKAKEMQNQREELHKEFHRVVEIELQQVRSHFQQLKAQWVKELEGEVASAHKLLVADPSRVLDQLKKETARLQQERGHWQREKKARDYVEARIAKYAGITASDAHKRDWVVVNAGGRRFETCRATLTSVPDSLLASMFLEHSEELFRTPDGVYHLDRDPDTFADVLTILRLKGNVPLDLAVTPSLRAEMAHLGLLEAYPLPSRLGTCGFTGHVFAAYRSTKISGNLLHWDQDDACSHGARDCVTLSQDKRRVQSATTGMFRITVRCVIATSGTKYVELRKNGTNVGRCSQCCSSGTAAKTYAFIELVQLNAGEYVEVYAQTGHCTEPTTSYLSMEFLPPQLVDTFARYQSTASNANTRQWNTTVKAIPSLSLGNSNKNVQCQRGGVFRVTARLHTYYNGNQTYMSLYASGNQYSVSYEAHHSGQPHAQVLLDDVVVMSHQNQYLQLQDHGYGSSNTALQEALTVQDIMYPALIGYWMSGNVTAENARRWDKECMNSGVLYTRVDQEAAVRVEEHGFYRISISATNRFQGDTHVSLMIDGNVVAVSRTGCGGGNYYHTGYITEIHRLAAGAKVSVGMSHPYNSQMYNRLVIERIVCVPKKDEEA